MRDNLKLEGRKKVVSKMTRDGLVEENLADQSVKRVSSRIQDADFSLSGEKAAEAAADGSSRAKRMQRRYAAKARDAASYGASENADASGQMNEAAVTAEGDTTRSYDSFQGSSSFESTGKKDPEITEGSGQEEALPERGRYSRLAGGRGQTASGDSPKGSNRQSKMYQKSRRAGNRHEESVRSEQTAQDSVTSDLHGSETDMESAEQPEGSTDDFVRAETETKSGETKSGRRPGRYQRLKGDTETAAGKAESAKERLPTGKKQQKQKVYDEAAKKAKSRLHFDDEPVMGTDGTVRTKVKSAGAKAVGTKAAGAAVSGTGTVVHGKVHEAEGDNVGVQAAHETEIAAESAGKTAISHVKSKAKEAPHERLTGLTHNAEKSGSRLMFESSAEAGPEIRKSKVRKMQQKRGIKQRYAAAYKASGGGAAVLEKTAGTAAMPKESAIKRIGTGIKNFARRNKGGIAVLGVCGLAAVMMISAFGTMGSMISEAGGAVVESTYLASDDAIQEANDYYTAMENALQAQINRIERDYPGYDEYRYQVDEISHNPYQLTSYLTVKYGNYTAAQVKDELKEIFEEQYSMAVHGETVTETVTRTVRVGESLGTVVTSGYCNCSICCGQWSGGPTASGVYPTASHTIAVDANNPFVPMGTHVVMNGTEYVVEDTGNFARYGVQFDVYYDDHTTAQNHGHQSWEAYLADSSGSNEIEVTETKTIRRLDVTATNHNLDLILRNRMDEDQQKLYAIYNASYGNRDYLFPVAQLQLPDGMSYEIPPEALSDVRFRNMITEAEKYLGYPYVWGGASPETSFDCSGFVSWVINHCGNGWNYGRLTAEGLRNICTYVSPAQAKPGDLIFFQGTYDTSGASHVGIYVGNGMMIHCGNPIQYASIETSYWQQHFYCFGRLP